MAKYIFITGGVSSSLGKGVSGASLGKLLQLSGFTVTMLKFDPYFNVDPGTMNPYQHGEVFVTSDGTETDLDLGYYERFLGVKTTKANTNTSGDIYKTVIEREIKGYYKGNTVQVIPHITDEIKNRFLAFDKDFDIVIIEIGGTVGDIEGLPFLEAIRQFRQERKKDETLSVHLTLLPYISAAGELKTKPAQHSASRLRNSGIIPDIIICRTEKPINDEIRRKIALFCSIKLDSVIEAADYPSIYRIPEYFFNQHLHSITLKYLNENRKQEINTDWFEQLKIKSKKSIFIVIIGKYVGLKDAYKSVSESLLLSALKASINVKEVYIDADDPDLESKLANSDGILIPGGYDAIGIDGKIKTIKYARENNIPFLGICLAMQCAVIEIARNLCGITDADSTEWNPDTKSPLICMINDQKEITYIDGIRRIGEYKTELKPDTLAYKLYGGQKYIFERHRNRYEFNPAYIKIVEDKGVTISAYYNNSIPEIIEIPAHPFFIATQFHPEFTSVINTPNPIFLGFVEASYKYKQSKNINK